MVNTMHRASLLFDKALKDFVSIDVLHESNASTAMIKDAGPLSDLLTLTLTSDEEKVIETILLRILQNKHNLVLAQQSELLATVLGRITTQSSKQSIAIAKLLIEHGLSPKVQRQLLMLLRDTTNANLYDITEHALSSTSPPSRLFSTDQDGFASIDFAFLPGNFPPSNSGYTLWTWLRVDKTDNDMHITLFGAFDPTYKTFVMAYIEKETNCLILQSSLKISVRFKYEFRVGVWYSIAISHKRPRGTSSARATLYVDGQALETLKLPYPASCTTPATVRAFLGTLKEFSSQKPSSVQYSMGHTMLVAQILLPELILQYHMLGPGYTGTFQDYLTTYMTYEASSELKAITETTEVSKPNTTVRNSVNMPENSILLCTSEATLISKLRSLPLSRESLAVLVQLHEAGITTVLLNQAIPDLSHAIVSEHGIGRVHGGVTSCEPMSFWSNIYKVGGSGVLLYLVEIAKTKEECLRTVRLCLHAVGKSYMVAEDFERSHAYEILGKLLKEKDSQCLCVELLVSILNFVGLEREFLINPLAYRYLIADFSIWQASSDDVQRVHLNQFLIFSNATSFGLFNNGKLARINIVKKFLSILRRGVPERVLQYYMIALKGLLTNNFSTENIRNVSSFIIFMLHKKGHRRKYSIKINGPDSQNLAQPDSKQNVGLAILRMLEELLCEPSSLATELLDKFAYTITNRWSLLLLSLPQTRISALRILARLLVTQGKSYITKFGGKNDGFTICEALLEKSREDIWPILFAILLGRDISQFSGRTSEEIYDELVSSSTPVLVPEILPVILSVFKHWSSEVVQQDMSNLTSFPSPREGQRAHARRTSLDTVMGETMIQSPIVAGRQTADLENVISLMVRLYDSSRTFRELCQSSTVSNEIRQILSPFIYTTDIPDLGLKRTDSASALSITSTKDDHTGSAISRVKDSDSIKSRHRAPSLRRSGSSFILLGLSRYENCDIPIEHGMQVDLSSTVSPSSQSSLGQSLMSFVVRLSFDGILCTTDIILPCLPAVNPESSQGQTVFWTTVLTGLVRKISDTLVQDKSMITTIRPFTNICKLFSSLYASLEDGHFSSGEIALFECVASVLEYVQLPEVSGLKTIRICDSSVSLLRQVLQKVSSICFDM